MSNASISRHVIALGQRNHIAWDQSGGREIADDPVSPHANRGRKQTLKGVECVVRPSFLPEREQAVHDNDGHNGDRERRQRGSGPQDHRKEMCELREELRERRSDTRARTCIWSELIGPERGLISGEAADPTVEGQESGVGMESMNRVGSVTNGRIPECARNRWRARVSA
jgi:hypothetical protein